MEMTPKDLGEHLERVREELGLSEEEMARDMGVAPDTYRGYARGERFPRLGSLKSLADRYMVNMDYLLGRCATRSPFSAGRPPAPPGRKAR